MDPAHVHRAKEALKVAQDILSRGDYDLVILDEIMVALYSNSFAARGDQPTRGPGIPQVEVVLTGRYAPRNSSRWLTWSRK